jgi:ABC-type multidrug transport system fused ATPase/permease subunit
MGLSRYHLQVVNGIKSRFNKSTLGRSVSVLPRRDRFRILVVAAIQISFSLLDLIGIALFGVLGGLAISGISANSPGNRVAKVLEFLGLADKTLQYQALILALLATLVFIAKTIFSIVFTRRTIFFLSRRGAVISSRLLSKLLSQPIVKVQARSVQNLTYSLTTGIESITIGVLNSCVQLISDFSLILIIAVGLFIVDPLVAISTFLLFASIAVLLYKLMQTRAERLGIARAALAIESLEKIQEVLTSYRESIVKNRRSYYSRLIGEKRLALANIDAERVFMPNISKYVIEITAVLGALLISALQFQFNDARHAVAVLSVFLAASTRISPAVLRMQQNAISIRGNLGSAGPTLELIEELNDVIDIENLDDAIITNHEGFVGDIVLENLSFVYPDSKKFALDSVSISIEEGNVVAIVGPSGAGKTTLVDTLLGVLIPESGSAKINDSSPLVSISRWPGAIGYVPQDVMISNGTIGENVSLGYPASNANEELIWDALEIAQLKEYVSSLPLGIHTLVGDRGTRISGGQRQRLGIARAMFTKPRLLILDEATSSLDGETEANISTAIQLMKGNVTILMIAHRLSTVRQADSVIYMESGKLLKVGTFQEVRDSIPNFDRQAQLMGL